MLLLLPPPPPESMGGTGRETQGDAKGDAAREEQSTRGQAGGIWIETGQEVELLEEEKSGLERELQLGRGEQGGARTGILF